MEIHVSLMTAIFASLGGTCVLISGFIVFQEIGEVNRKLPENERISYWGMHVDKARKITHEYKRLYPGGKLHYLTLVFALVGFVFLLLASMSAGFPPWSLKH